MQKKTLHILYLEDNLYDVEMLTFQLKELEEYDCSIMHVSNKQSYLDALDSKKHNLVLCDYQLPSYNGMEALEELKRRSENTPFIFVTGATNEETAVEAIKAGAWDYILKDRLLRLPTAIRRAISLKEEYDNRKRMDRELIEAKENAERSNKLKDAFLQNLSHEIRTPLNSIVGFSSLLNEPGISKESISSYISIINRNSDQLLSIVTDILTISRIDTGNEPINNSLVGASKLLYDICRDMTNQAEEKGIELKCSVPDNSEHICLESDLTKVTQIITNLVSNAIKFTEKGKVELSYSLSGEEIIFRVSDNGIGIKPEFHEIIFERFRQVQNSDKKEAYRGTGLGLSISKSFAELLNGKLWVNSELGKGSNFYLSLPYRKDLRIPKNQVVEHTPTKRFTKEIKLLVAEDEVYNYTLIEALLNKENVTFFHAMNGKLAINLIENNPQINLVLMDIKMPVMDGIEAFSAIRKINKNIPIIAQTAHAMAEDRERFLKLGFTDYIPKPIKRDELYEKIARAIGD